MREIREILKDLGAEILSMKEAGVDIDIVEDGDTFAANALIKAKAVWEKTGRINRKCIYMAVSRRPSTSRQKTG